jgi:hypothetical protein
MKTRAVAFRFFGPGHDADAGDGRTKTMVPVVGGGDALGAISDGGGTGHGRKHAGMMKKRERGVGVIKYPRRRSVRLE